MKILTVDPGVGGGMALYDSADGTLELEKFTTEHEFITFARRLLTKDHQATAYVEDVPSYVSRATSNASSFKLGYNFGFEVGVLRGMDVPVNLVGPKSWQKGLRGLKPKMGYTERKRQLKDNAVRLYPDYKITNATADAVLILDWVLRQK